MTYRTHLMNVFNFANGAIFGRSHYICIIQDAARHNIDRGRTQFVIFSHCGKIEGTMPAIKEIEAKPTGQLTTKFSFMEENKNIEKRAEIPSFVYRDGMIADKEYIKWLSEVKARFRQSQIKASVRVNTSMLEFFGALAGIWWH